MPEGTRLGMAGLEWLKQRSLDPHRLSLCRKLNKLADDLGTSLAKLAIAWCAKNPNVSTVILGASKRHHLEETLTSLEIIPKITAEVNQQIEDILENKPEHPMF